MYLFRKKVLINVHVQYCRQKVLNVYVLLLFHQIVNE